MRGGREECKQEAGRHEEKGVLHMVSCEVATMFGVIKEVVWNVAGGRCGNCVL